jgi:hypothetical protein
MRQFFSLLSWRLFTAQHVSGVFPPIIRSSMTAVTASGFTFVSWWQSCCVRGRAGRPDHDQQHCYHYAPTVKLEATTAVVELLMMGVRTPETCWTVHKRKVINLKLLHLIGWFIWTERWCTDLQALNQFSLYDVPPTCFGHPLGDPQQRNTILAHHKVANYCLLLICSCWIKCCIGRYVMWKSIKSCLWSL